jgi:hypothetical protein
MSSILKGIKRTLATPFEFDDYAIWKVLSTNADVAKFVKIERSDVATDITGESYHFEKCTYMITL